MIAPTKQQRFEIVNIISGLANKYQILTWRLVDTHIHLLVVQSRESAGKLTQVLETVINKRLNLAIGFSPGFIKPIANQNHLLQTFQYIMRQEDHHQTLIDPFHDASNLPDLLNLRVFEKPLYNHISDYLPRIKRSTLLHFLKRDPTLETKSYKDLREAIKSATGIYHLKKNIGIVRKAKRAALFLSKKDLSPVQQAGYLEISTRTIRRLKQKPPEPSLVSAIKAQLAMRQATD